MTQKRISVLSRLAACLALATFAASAAAATFTIGDIFASTGSGNVQHYNSAGTLLETLNTGQGGYTTGSAFDSAGNLYVTNFSASSVTKFAGPSDPHTASLTLFGNATNEAIVFLANGNVLVGGVGSGGIKVFSSTGTLLQTVLPGVRVDWFDVGADQDTIYFTQEGQQVRKTSISSGGNSVFASVGDFALRILSNGNLLVASDNNINLLSATGSILNTYDVAGVDGFFALNLATDGTSFYSGSFNNDTFYRFDIASGNVLQTINTNCGGNCFFGLSVYGELTASNPNPPTVPEPGTVALMGVALGGLALARRRRTR